MAAVGAQGGRADGAVFHPPVTEARPSWFLRTAAAGYRPTSSACPHGASPQSPGMHSWLQAHGDGLDTGSAWQRHRRGAFARGTDKMEREGAKVMKIEGMAHGTSVVGSRTVARSGPLPQRARLLFRVKAAMVRGNPR